MAKLAKYSYSRDRQPAESQLTLGAVQLAPPCNIPIGLTVEAGNINDQAYMWKTYGQVRPFLQERSLVVFEREANDKDNLDWIGLDRNDYLTAKNLNAPDDEIFGSFSNDSWECIDAEASIAASLTYLSYSKTSEIPQGLLSKLGFIQDKKDSLMQL
jgi:transposase